jgi:hypothetical protein
MDTGGTGDRGAAARGGVSSRSVADMDASWELGADVVRYT